MHLFAALCLSSLLSLAVGQQCHQDWVYHNGSCYGYAEDMVSFGDAQVLCISFGATLAEITSLEESTYLKSMTTARNGDYYWIGGTDIFHEGVWEWVGSGEPIYPFTDWGSGQPNDAQGQDCLSLDQSLGYLWNDADCAETFYFICEANPSEVIVG